MSDSPPSKTSPRRSVWARWLVFLGVALSLLALLHAYVASQFVGWTQATGLFRVAIWMVVFGLFASIPVSLFAFRRAPSGPARAVAEVGRIWLGAFGLVLCAVFFIQLGFALASEISPRIAWIPYLGQWQAAAALVVSTLGIVLGLRSASAPARIDRVEVPLARLAPAFDGFRIAQISDLHIGEALDETFLERVVAQVNALKPDAVAITGDLVDGELFQVGPKLAALAQLNAKDGVYYVTGNHEYYHGGALWERAVADLGITVLHNAHRLVKRDGASLVMAGVTDIEAGRFSPKDACNPRAALQGAPDDAARILLAHQPRAIHLAEGERVDLQLSGHTHGGQIFPFMFFVRLQQPVVKGLKTIAGSLVYTSRGTGYWGPPLRVGAAPEITEITLRQVPRADSPR